MLKKLRFPLFGLLLCVAVAGLVSAGPSPVFEEKELSPAAVALDGKVLPLAAILKDKGLEFDEDDKDAVPAVALVGPEGRVYTIIKSGASRMLFVDDRLQDRPLRLIGKIVPGTQMIQVEQVRSVVDGKAMVVDYWCPNCELRYLEPGECMCCGNEVQLRERPAPETPPAGAGLQVRAAAE